MLGVHLNQALQRGINGVPRIPAEGCSSLLCFDDATCFYDETYGAGNACFACKKITC
jgi:hypothetical protein